MPGSLDDNIVTHGPGMPLRRVRQDDFFPDALTMVLRPVIAVHKGTPPDGVRFVGQVLFVEPDGVHHPLAVIFTELT